MDFFSRLETLVLNLCKLVEGLAPIAQVIAPMTGSAAPVVAAGAAAANAIATATDKAITAHDAAGQTPQTAAAGLASIAQTVAASGLVDTQTATKINIMTRALDPAIQAALTGG